MSKKTIILTQKQLNEIMGGNSTYLDNADNNFREYLDNEISVTSKLDNSDGKPVTTDNISKNLSHSNDSFGFTKQVVPGNYTTESKLSWSNKHKINEDNQDLVNRQYNIGTADVPEYVSYTNLTTKKNELESERKRLGNNFPHEMQEKLDRINRVYSNAKSNSQNIRNSKKQRGERVIKQHTKQAFNGKAHTKKNTTNGIITYEK